MSEVKPAVEPAPVPTTQVIQLPAGIEQQLLQDYLACPSWAPGTYREYSREIRAFRGFLSKPLLEATRKDIESFVHAQLEDGKARATVARKLSVLRSVYRFAVQEGALMVSPAAAVRAPKVGDESPRLGLSSTEARQLLQSVDRATPIGLRDRALLLLLLTNALRINEVLGLQVEDLREEGGYRVAAILGKGNKPALIPLAPVTWSALEDWLQVTEIEEGPVFRSMTKSGEIGPRRMSARGASYRVQWLAKKAGIDKRISPHSFRHTAITLALEAGQPLHLVQDLARHADPRTTRRYDRARQSLNNPVPATLVSVLEQE